MEAGSSSAARSAEPTETTALLSSPASDGPQTSPHQHDQESGSPDVTTRPDRLIQTTYGLVWTSLVLSVLTAVLGISLLILINVSPRGFYPRYYLMDGVAVVTSLSVIAIIVNIWNLHSNNSRLQTGGFGLVFNVVFDVVASFYIIAFVARAVNFLPNLSDSCYTYGRDRKPDPKCAQFRDIFNAIASSWAIVGLLLGFSHFGLVITRILRYLRVHRNTRWISYEGTSASETIASLALSLGPFAFDARFRVLHPSQDLPASEVETGRAPTEDSTTTVNTARPVESAQVQSAS